VLCCDAKDVRLDGRAIPARLILTPDEAGLRDARIEWVEIRPAQDLRGWRRARLPQQEGTWTLRVLDLPGAPAPGIAPSLGTARFAASVALPSPSGGTVSLDTDGARAGADRDDPDRVPGVRVTRHGGDTVPGRAMGFARLPVRVDAGPSHVRARAAIRPVDLFLRAYEDLSGAPWPEEASTALDDDAWSWLLETVARGHRRASPRAAVVGTDGRGIAWSRPASSPGVRRGDLVVSSEQLAILERDDGDGWLGNGDQALHGVSGRLASGTLADLPPGPLAVLRPRDFTALAARLGDAGYGPLPSGPVWSAAARRALGDFQRDRGLPSTGLPDDATASALEEFARRLDAAGAASPDAGAR
jgi:hypothetical protein